MAENVLKLKKEAVKLGMDKSEARTANRSTLENFIAKAGKSKVAKKKGGTSSTASKKSAAKKSVGKKTTAAKRSKSAPAAQSAKSGKAKRPTTTRKSSKSTTSNGGRHLIGSLDFSVTDGWNPREGSPVAEIFKALKKAKGNVDKTFDALVPRVKDFVSTRKNDGSKRTKAEMEAMLRYRINRTKFQFALQTGQHESSTERVEYGTGPYASSKKAKSRRVTRTKAKASTRKPNTRKAGKKAGRKAKR